MKSYRDGIRIMYEILDCIAGTTDCKISIISRNTNLAHHATEERLKKFIDHGLVFESLEKRAEDDCRTGPKAKIFNITEKGIHLLRKLADMFHELEKMGMEV